MWPMQMMSATVNADLMRFYGEYAYGSISNIPRTGPLYCTVHLFPDLRTFWYLGKSALHKILLVGLYECFN